MALPVDARSAWWVVPGDAAGPAVARDLLAETLPAWGLGEVLFEAQLLVSELVRNAGVHAGAGEVRLRATARGHQVRVEVFDGDRDRVPTLLPRHPANVGGLGLRIVAGTAPRWGTSVHETGKAVWFELDAPDPADD